MKTHITTLFALVALAASGVVNAEASATLAQRPQVVAASKQRSSESTATKLSPEEMAFAAKLSDSNRKAFTEKLTVEQRQAAMKAAKSATISNAPDEAVARIFHGNDLALVEVEDHDSIASADELIEDLQEEEDHDSIASADELIEDLQDEDSF